jgi:hypothetical protein
MWVVDFTLKKMRGRDGEESRGAASWLHVRTGRKNKFDRVICRTCVRPYGGPAALGREKQELIAFMCVCNDELIPPLARSLVEENRVTRAHACRQFPLDGARRKKYQKHVRHDRVRFTSRASLFSACLSALLIGKSRKQTLNLQRKAKSNLKL